LFPSLKKAVIADRAGTPPRIMQIPGSKEALKQIHLKKQAGAFTVFSEENPAQLPLENTRLVVWVFHLLSEVDLVKSF